MKLKLGLLGAFMAALLMLTSFQVASAETNWNSNVIQVKGYSLPNAPRTSARRVATTDAYRLLAEAVQGVNVDAETTVAQMELVSDVIKTKVSATIKGARIVSEGYVADGSYEVVMELPMFGEGGGLAAAVIERPAAVIPFPEPKPVAPAPDQPSVTVTVQGGYTGVIIDCRNLSNKIKPVMSPVIKDASGAKLYGHENLNYELIIRDGMASYVTDRGMATRAGSNPLIIKAERLDDLNATPVISVSDGSRLLSENKSAGFLAKTAVVFLY